MSYGLSVCALLRCTSIFFFSAQSLFIFDTNLVFALTFSLTAFFLAISFQSFVPFFHFNLIYSFRIACFSIKFDAGSVGGTRMESRFHLTHYRMLFFNKRYCCFIRPNLFLLLSFSLSSTFFILSRDNCLFRRTFTSNFDIIWYSMNVCECVCVFCLFSSVLMIFILAFVLVHVYFFIFFFFFGRFVGEETSLSIVYRRLFAGFLCEVFLISGHHHFLSTLAKVSCTKRRSTHNTAPIPSLQIDSIDLNYNRPPFCTQKYLRFFLLFLAGPSMRRKKSVYSSRNTGLVACENLHTL